MKKTPAERRFAELNGWFREIMTGQYAAVIGSTTRRSKKAVAEEAMVVRALIDGLFLQWLEEPDWEARHSEYKDLCVRSIIASLHSDDFVRFRVGVGKPEGRGPGHGVDHVLGRFSREEEESLGKVIDGVASALETAVTGGLTRAMDLYNRAGSLGCEELP